MFFKILPNLIAVLFSVFAYTGTIAQTPKTLLWKVSGKGRAQPSYLFGTIHIMDKQVFSFTDSVYSAIERSEGLAIELNPDDMMSYAITRATDIRTQGRELREVLSREDYLKYAPLLARKLKKAQEKLLAKDIIDARSQWLTNTNFKQSMQTFVDAWLYGVAKASGKWVGGIEDPSDQGYILEQAISPIDLEAILSDNTAKANSAMLQKMIKIYNDQDLDGIYNFTAGLNTEQRDEILSKRNIKMAHRIDSLSAVRSVFFAVGAAHLPGQDGLIQLLRKKGFLVEPVISSRKIPAESYQYKQLPVTWTQAKDLLYTIEMPGNPTTVKIQGLFDAFFYMDIFNYSGYYAMSAYKSAGDAAFSEKMVRKMYPNGKVERLKSSVDDGLNGQEFLVIDKSLYLRFRVVSSNNQFFLLMMVAKSREQLFGSDARKYFSSFKLIPINSVSPQYFTYSDSVLGVSVKTPAPLNYNEQLSNDNSVNWRVRAYTATDISRGMYIMLFSKEVKRHWYIISDSSNNDELDKILSKSYTGYFIKDTTVDQVPVRMFCDMRTPSYPAMRTKVLSAFRGNRNIIVYITSSDTATSNKAVVQEIISSLKFKQDQESTNWNYYTNTDSTFKVWVPSAITSNPVEVNLFDREEMAAYDTLSATSYTTLFDKPQPFYWTDKYSDLQELYRNITTDEQDTILYNKDVKIGGLQGYELLSRKKKTGTFKRSQILFADNGIYVLSAVSQKEALFTANVNRFFKSFELISRSEKFDYITSKSSLLLQTLSSGDSLLRTTAFDYLANAPFSTGDVQVLNQTLFDAYAPLNETQDSFYVADIISTKLQELADPSTITYIRDYFPTISKGDNDRKNLALATLAGILTRESYETLGALLSTAELSEAPYVKVREHITDSLALTCIILDKLLPMSADSLYTPFIASVMLGLLENNLLSDEQLAPFADYFIANAQKLQTSFDKTDVYDYNIVDLIGLLPLLKRDDAVRTTQAFQHIADNEIKIAAISALLENSLDPDTRVIENLSAGKEYRTYLFERLKSAHRESLFPKKYLSQKHFAESEVYNSVDDYIPEGMELLGERQVQVDQKTYRFYLFKVTFVEEGEKSVFLGISGGYANPSDLQAALEFSGIYWDKAYEKGKVDEQFNEYLKIAAGD